MVNAAESLYNIFAVTKKLYLSYKQLAIQLQSIEDVI